MKSKNERDFTLIRVKRETMKKIKQINADHTFEKGEHVSLYETVAKIVNEIENKQGLRCT